MPARLAKNRSGTTRIAGIALKNLQNPRICHVPMSLANSSGSML
jgi:hypothetical protein